jgi:hypothetical protein
VHLGADGHSGEAVSSIVARPVHHPPCLCPPPSGHRHRLQVRKAKKEMLRVLEEETLRLGASVERSAYGKFSVV